MESSKEVLGPEWGVGDRVKADWVSAGPAQARARNNVNTSRRVRGDLPNIALYERIADATALSLVDTDGLMAIYKTASQAASLPCG